MVKAAELTEHYTDEPHRKIYTFKEMGIPGLILLGRHNSRSANIPMPGHYHRDRIEIRLLVQGNIIFLANGKEYRLKGGDVFITPANIPHSSGLHPSGICEMYWFQLLLNKLPFLFLEKMWAVELQRQLGSLQTGVIRGIDFSRKYLDGMFCLLTSDSVINKYWGCSRLLTILHEIIAARLETQDSPSADIQKAIHFIRANIYDEITLESCAVEAGLALTRFSLKFSEQIGMPPHMFINMQKIEKARELLAEGKSVTNTAFDLGFNSSAYFSTIFRKFTCMSPSEFIRKNQTPDSEV